jgi:hypothetical protein
MALVGNKIDLALPLDVHEQVNGLFI